MTTNPNMPPDEEEQADAYLEQLQRAGKFTVRWMKYPSSYLKSLQPLFGASHRTCLYFDTHEEAERIRSLMTSVQQLSTSVVELTKDGGYVLLSSDTHHRRYSGESRACELDNPGLKTPDSERDTSDPMLATCPRCLSSLASRRLLSPSIHQIAQWQLTFTREAPFLIVEKADTNHFHTGYIPVAAARDLVVEYLRIKKHYREVVSLALELSFQRTSPERASIIRQLLADHQADSENL